MVLRPQIGLLLDLLGSQGRGIAKGVAAYVHFADWRLVSPPTWAFRAYMPSISSSLDGLIADCHDEKMIAQAQNYNVPVVNISAAMEHSPFPSVTADNQEIGRLAAEHLLGLGLRHFAFIYSFDVFWYVQRGRSFTNAMKDAGFSVHTFRLPETRDTDPTETAALKEWLRQLPLPIGLFVPHDPSAARLEDLCRELGLKIPEQVALLSCEDDEMVQRFAAPPLSSIQMNAERQGFLAAQLMDDLLHGRKPPEQPIRVPPAGLSVRLSTEILSFDDLEVATALRFIREHAAASLTVEDVVASVPLSRRPLEKRFRQALKRSILDEIHRVKIERSKRLLNETQLSVEQIAKACGLRYATRLGIIFHKHTGQTPQQFRIHNRKQKSRA